MHCVAVCCTVLQSVAGCYSVLQRVAVCCSMHIVCMHCVAVCLRVLQCVKVESQLSSFVTVVLAYKHSHDMYMYTWQPFATRLVTSSLDVYVDSFVRMNIRCASWRMRSCVRVWHTLLMPFAILDGGKRSSWGMCVSHTHTSSHTSTCTSNYHSRTKYTSRLYVERRCRSVCSCRRW